MVAAEDETLRVEAGFGCDALHEGAEIIGRHTGIATILVHLVAGRLDQDILPRSFPSCSAARMTSGWAEHTEVMPIAFRSRCSLGRESRVFVDIGSLLLGVAIFSAEFTHQSITIKKLIDNDLPLGNLDDRLNVTPSTSR